MTRLTGALRGVTRLGIDTSPFIYFLERHPTYGPLVREVLEYVEAGTIWGCSSVVTLTEVLTLPKRHGDIAVETAYRTLLLHSRHFTLLPVEVAAADLAATLRARYTLRSPDALQIAVALEAGCDAFLTNDLALRRVTELQVIVLEEWVS